MISSRSKSSLKREFSQSFLAKLGLFLLGAAFFVAIFAPILAPHDPTQQTLANRNLPPILFGGTWEHPLGTDPLGRDLLSRVLYGARTSLLVGITATGFGAIVGISLGLVSGYYRGLTDDIIMRSVDVSLAIPGLVLALTVYTVLGPVAIEVPDPFVTAGLEDGMPESFTFPGTVSFVIGVMAFRHFARLARGEALRVREEVYVKASQSAGGSGLHVMTKHVLPNVMTPLLVFGTLRLAHAILTESTLSFLGFSGTTLSWGWDIAAGRDYLATAWWITSIPGLAILFAVVGINLVGDWLRDALDPGLQEGMDG